MAVDVDISAPAATHPDARGLLDLMDGEQTVTEMDGADHGRFVLTNRRVIYTGGGGGGSIYASARLADVTSVAITRRPRDHRSAWWGVAGLIAAIGVWQVTDNDGVGAAAGVIVGIISIVLLADYWFRPPGIIMSFTTAGASVEGPVDGRSVDEAEVFGARLEAVRQQLSAQSPAEFKPAVDSARRTGYPAI